MALNEVNKRIRNILEDSITQLALKQD